MAADGLITFDIKTSGDTKTLDVIKKQITALTNAEKIYNKNQISINSSLKETNKLFANELNLLASLKVEMGVNAVLAEQAFAGQTEATRLMIENLAIEISTVLIPTLNALLVWIASNMPVINLLAGYTLLGIKNTLDGIGLSIGGLVIPQFEALLKWAQDNAKPLTDAFEQAFNGAKNSINNISGVFNTLNSKMRTTLSLISQVKTQLSSLGVKSASTKSNEFSGVSGSVGLGSAVSSNNDSLSIFSALGSVLSNGAILSTTSSIGSVLSSGANLLSELKKTTYGSALSADMEAKAKLGEILANPVTKAFSRYSEGLSTNMEAYRVYGESSIKSDYSDELNKGTNALSFLSSAKNIVSEALASSDIITPKLLYNFSTFGVGQFADILEKSDDEQVKTAGQYLGTIAAIFGGPLAFLAYTMAHAKTDEETKKTLEEIDLNKFIRDKKYAVGTPYLPNDMIALVHEGEMIVPKSQNPYAGANRIKSALNVSNADRAAASNSVSNVTYTFNSPKALSMSDVLREMRLAEQRKVLLGV